MTKNYLDIQIIIELKTEQFFVKIKYSCISEPFGFAVAVPSL